MAASGYPGRDDHITAHTELRSTLANLVEDFEEDGATHSLAEAIDTFLGNWLINHIRSVDTLLGAYMKEEGLNPRD